MDYNVMYKGTIHDTRNYHVAIKGEILSRVVVDEFGVVLQADKRQPKKSGIYVDIWTDDDGNRYCRALRCSENSTKAREIIRMPIPQGIDDDVVKKAILSQV